jgi:hypothetical protein
VRVAAQQLGDLFNSWEFRFDAGCPIGTSSGDDGLDALQHSQRLALFIYGITPAAMTTTVATAVTI